MINDRCIKILNVLKRTQDYVTCAELASRFHVSTRTIRNDLIKIEDFLLKHHQTGFERNHQNGIRFMHSENLHDLFQSFGIDVENYVYKKDEIRTFILLKLLYEKEAISPKYFEDFFQVSRSTIFNIMNDLSHYLNDKRILFVKTTKVGVTLSAHAIYKIQELASQILNRCDLAQFYDYIEFAKVDPYDPTKTFLTHIVDQNISLYLKNYIVKIETELSKTFDDASFIKVLVFLSKMIANKLEHEEGVLHEDMQSLIVTNEYRVARHIIEDLQYEFLFQNDDYIETSLTLLLLMCKSEDGSSSEGPFLDLSYRLISKVEKQLGMTVFNQDDLAHFLALHIQPMIYRYKTNILFENPLFLQILSDYKDIYEAVRTSVEIIEQECHMQVNNHEVSFIAIHFASSLNKDRFQSMQKKRVVVVCVEGIAISHKIAYAIERNFDVEVTQIIALRNLNDAIIKENDFVIANIDLPIHTRKFIKITSQMNASDMLLLAQAFHQEKSESQNLAKVENLMNAIKKWCTIKDLEGLQFEVLQVMKETNVLSKQANKLPMYFDKACVSTQYVCTTWKDAVIKSCEPLLEKGWIAHSYQEKILHNISAYGGYMVVAPFVMLAHAGVEDGVYKNCLSIITCKQGFDLKNQYQMPIQIVITLAVTDEKSHLLFLNELMELLKDKVSVQRMISMDSASEVYRFFKQNVQF